MSKELLTFLQENLNGILRDLEDLVQTESPSTEKSAVDNVSRVVTGKFRSLGARVEMLAQAEYGDHVRVEWGEGDQQVLILCHMDTVFGLGETVSRPFRVEEGKAYGPGVYDMKAGIVQTLWALKAMRALGKHPKCRVVLLLNSDEEVGSPTSRPIIEAEAQKSQVAFVLEPSVPPGALKTARKGVGRFEMWVTGKASHAGSNPEAGISAIQEMALQVQRLHALSNPTTGTTVNVGVVRAGTRPNVVAAEAYAEIDLRVTTMAEADRVVKAILDCTPFTQARVKITGGLNRPPMERSPQIAALFTHAKALAADLGFDLLEASTGGGSDGNFTAALGVPTIDGLGAVGNGAHSVDEYLMIDELPRRTALLVRLLETVGAGLRN